MRSSIKEIEDVGQNGAWDAMFQKQLEEMVHVQIQIIIRFGFKKIF